MNTTSNSKPSFGTIIILTWIAISTFAIFLFAFGFWDNYTFIKYKNQFEKIKVKIDSSKVFTTRSGKSSSTSSSTCFYFNKGCFLSVKETKGILLNYNDPTEDIYNFMSNHRDSINLWYLNKDMMKYAYENQRKIDVSEEEGNNKRIVIYFLIYIISILLIIKLKTKKS